MALLRVLTVFLAAACLVVASTRAQVPAKGADSRPPVYHVRAHLFEGFDATPSGVYASFYYGVGNPSFPDYRAEKKHLLDTFQLREALPFASLDMRVRAETAARRPIALYDNGRRAALVVEAMPIRDGERLLLDMRLLYDDVEVFHSGTAAAEGRAITVGAEHKPTGRKFFLTVKAERTDALHDAAPVMLKTPRSSPPPAWPDFPAKLRAAGARGSVMLDARGGPPRALWTNAPPELLDEALRAAVTWGEAVGFVHFRPGT